MDVISGLLVVATLIVLYFMPVLVAFFRDNKNTTAIFITNLFFGWTFLGWVISLIWAVKV